MKKQSILNLNISSINDITKIEESCKYIDLDLTNYSSEVINYFLKNGSKDIGDSNITILPPKVLILVSIDFKA